MQLKERKREMNLQQECKTTALTSEKLLSNQTPNQQATPDNFLEQEVLDFVNEPITLEDIKSVNLFNEKETKEITDEELKNQVRRMRRERMGLGARLVMPVVKEKKVPKEKKTSKKKIVEAPPSFLEALNVL